MKWIQHNFCYINFILTLIVFYFILWMLLPLVQYILYGCCRRCRRRRRRHHRRHWLHQYNSLSGSYNDYQCVHCACMLLYNVWFHFKCRFYCCRRVWRRNGIYSGLSTNWVDNWNSYWHHEYNEWSLWFKLNTILHSIR